MIVIDGGCIVWHRWGFEIGVNFLTPSFTFHRRFHVYLPAPYVCVLRCASAEPPGGCRGPLCLLPFVGGLHCLDLTLQICARQACSAKKRMKKEKRGLERFRFVSYHGPALPLHPP